MSIEKTNINIGKFCWRDGGKEVKRKTTLKMD